MNLDQYSPAQRRFIRALTKALRPYRYWGNRKLREMVWLAAEQVNPELGRDARRYSLEPIRQLDKMLGRKPKAARGKRKGKAES
jgi:hypothetical protein